MDARRLRGDGCRARLGATAAVAAVVLLSWVPVAAWAAVALGVGRSAYGRAAFPAGPGNGAKAVGWVCLLLVLLLPGVAWGQQEELEKMLEAQRDEDAWKKVVDCKGAEKYLEERPKGLRAKEARECVDWARVRSCEDAGAVERFLADHPESRYAAEARECLVWAGVQGCEDAGAAERFLADHPESRYADEARECLAWVEVRSCEDVEKVGEFRRRFPDGRYAAEAEACVALTVARVQEALKGIAAHYTGKAREALERERPEEAKSAIEQLKEISPKHPGVEDLETGLANLERVLDQRQKDERAIEALAGKVEALLSEGKHEQARAELAAGRKGGLSGKRLSALEERIDRDALVAEVRALVGAENVAEARARLAEARKGLLSGEARSELEAAIEEAETTGRDAQVAEAMARLVQKEYGAAREALDRARALGLPDARYEELSERIGRGERQARVSALHEKCLGHVDEREYAPAIECYREVLELDPEDATAQYAMRELPKQLSTE